MYSTFPHLPQKDLWSGPELSFYSGEIPRAGSDGHHFSPIVEKDAFLLADPARYYGHPHVVALILVLRHCCTYPGFLSGGRVYCTWNGWDSGIFLVRLGPYFTREG